MTCQVAEEQEAPQAGQAEDRWVFMWFPELLPAERGCQSPLNSALFPTCVLVQHPWL